MYLNCCLKVKNNDFVIKWCVWVKKYINIQYRIVVIVLNDCNFWKCFRKILCNRLGMYKVYSGSKD